MDDTTDKLYFGKILILSMENPDFVIPNIPDTSIFSLTIKNVKFVHYSDSQQLQITLNQPGQHYSNIKLYSKNNKILLWEKPMTDVLIGPYRLVLDTLDIMPGLYDLILSQNNTNVHIIYFEKLEVEPKVENLEPTFSSGEYIVYRSGTGEVLPNEDLEMREAVLKNVYHKLSRTVEYRNVGRGGYAIYKEGDRKLELSMEYMTGNALFSLDFPNSENWEKFTEFTLPERIEVLEFIANRVRRDHTYGDAYFEIGASSMIFYKEPSFK